MIYVVFQDRLGNNLFQLAAALSLDENVSICACNSEIYEATLRYKDIFFKDIPLLDHIPEGVKVYDEPFFHFSKIPYVKDTDLAIKGYFQSHKYIDQQIILNKLETPDFVDSFIKNNYPEILKNEHTSVHVRRGDYLNALYEHPVCSSEYYRDAMALIGQREKYVFLSDDIAWCKKNFKGDNFIFIENSSEIVDLFIPNYCKNNIISNSSFGWWGAFLNTNAEKSVIAPSPWFGFRNLNNTKDLLPDNWTVIPSTNGVYSFLASRIQFLIHHIQFRLGLK